MANSFFFDKIVQDKKNYQKMGKHFANACFVRFVGIRTDTARSTRLLILYKNIYTLYFTLFNESM